MRRLRKNIKVSHQHSLQLHEDTISLEKKNGTVQNLSNVVFLKQFNIRLPRYEWLKRFRIVGCLIAFDRLKTKIILSGICLRPQLKTTHTNLIINALHHSGKITL